jgi:hypothetical protein
MSLPLYADIESVILKKIQEDDVYISLTEFKEEKVLFTLSQYDAGLFLLKTHRSTVNIDHYLGWVLFNIRAEYLLVNDFYPTLLRIGHGIEQDKIIEILINRLTKIAKHLGKKSLYMKVIPSEINLFKKYGFILKDSIVERLKNKGPRMMVLRL